MSPHNDFEIYHTLTDPETIVPRLSAPEKRKVFRHLHRSGCFVMPNPWDAGSATALAQMGFKALATTSSGYAWSCAHADGQLTRAQVLAHLRSMVESVDLPINADFESGFADTLTELEESVALIIETGVAGFSIEDASGDARSPLMNVEDAAQRISVARSTIDKMDGDTLLVARAENFFVGVPDLDDTIARLQAYADAGADCLYAPGIRTREHIKAVVAAVAPKPVNVLIGWNSELTVKDLAALGVRRISVGGALARSAWGGFLQAAQHLAEEGRFDFGPGAPSGSDMNQLFKID